jgi:hypothetical protein
MQDRAIRRALKVNPLRSSFSRPFQTKPRPLTLAWLLRTSLVMRHPGCRDEHRHAPLRSTLGIVLGGAFAFLLAAACGSNRGSANTTALDGATGCPTGESYCATCGGSGFCGQTCPTISCPNGGGDGGASDGSTFLEGGQVGNGPCPASATTKCVDCNGSEFCVAGVCPEMECVAKDAGSDAALDAYRPGSCIPLSCEGLNCECGSCPDNVCGSGFKDCGECEGGATCMANKCVPVDAAIATDASPETCRLPDGGTASCNAGGWVCCKVTTRPVPS